MTNLNWIGSKGQSIELRAECKTEMVKTKVDLDGHIFEGEEKPLTTANLELYVDGKKVDSCQDINFWKVIETSNGIKKIWGLNVGMSSEQAVIVENFLNEIIKNGKSVEVIESEKIEAAKETAENVENANKTIAKYESQTLKMNKKQYQEWKINYNNINNEGGEGYVPHLITTEQYEYAKSIIGGTL